LTDRGFVFLPRIDLKKESSSVTFSEESLKFLTWAGKQNDAEWLAHHDAKYQRLIRAPLLALADTVKQ